MEGSYLKKLSALLLSLAICMTFMPFVSVEAYAADGEWYLISQYNDNYYFIDLEKGVETAVLDVTDYLVIDPDEESADPLTYDDFEYQWSVYSEEDGYTDLEGETSTVLSASEGSYRCSFTNKEDPDDYGYAYYEVRSAESYVDGSWYLVDDGDYSISFGKNDTSLTLDAKSKIKIDYEDDDPDNDLTVDDFEYQWFEYDDDLGYNELEETGSTLNVGNKYGEYKCRITNTRGTEDYLNAYFYVHEYRASIVSAEFSSNGIHELKEYTNGYFTRDGKYDANENFIPETDYYFYYSGSDYEDEGDYIGFNLGDKITVKYDDNTTVVYTYQEKEFYDEEDGEYWTRKGFYNSDNVRLYTYINLDGSGQSYTNRLGIGSTVNAKVYVEDYDEENYSEIIVKDFAKIVKNPEAAWIDGAFYRLNSYEKGADLRDFYRDNVTEFKVPARVAMGDGKEYPVRRISGWIWGDVDSLKKLTVPSSVHSVGDFAFGLTETYDSKTEKWVAVPIKDFTLYASTGSAAYEYAKEFGINVIDNNSATNGSALAEAQKNAETKAKEAEAAKAEAEAKAKEAEAAKADSGTKAQEVAAAQAEAAKAKADAEAKAKEAETAKNELAKLKAQIKTVKSFKASAKKKGKAQLKWKKTSGVTGYQIYRSTKKSSGFKKVATIKKASTKKWNDKKLKNGKTYYYKIRTYTVVNGKNVYGQWSEVKKIKGKK